MGCMHVGKEADQALIKECPPLEPAHACGNAVHVSGHIPSTEAVASLPSKPMELAPNRH